jgi:hypothetical protein
MHVSAKVGSVTPFANPPREEKSLYLQPARRNFMKTENKLMPADVPCW